MQWLIDLICDICGGGQFTDRGETFGPDFALVDFIRDGVVYTKDISAIVPDDVDAVLLRFQLNYSPGPNAGGFVYPSFFTVGTNGCELRPQIPNRSFDVQCIVQLDSNRTFKYLFDPGTWSTINMWVRGWW